MAVQGQKIDADPLRQARAALVVEDDAILVGQRLQPLERPEISAGATVEDDDRGRALGAVDNPHVQSDTGHCLRRKGRVVCNKSGYGVVAACSQKQGCDRQDEEREDRGRPFQDSFHRKASCFASAPRTRSMKPIGRLGASVWLKVPMRVMSGPGAW